MTDNKYVGVGNFVDLRRDVLTTSKEIIMNLQVAEELKDLRTNKLSAVKDFDNELKEVRSLIRKLRKYFPKNNVSTSKTPVKKEEPSKKVEKVDVSQFEHDLESLERELASLGK